MIDLSLEDDTIYFELLLIAIDVIESWWISLNEYISFLSLKSQILMDLSYEEEIIYLSSYLNIN